MAFLRQNIVDREVYLKGSMRTKTRTIGIRTTQQGSEAYGKKKKACKLVSTNQLKKMQKASIKPKWATTCDQAWRPIPLR